MTVWMHCDVVMWFRQDESGCWDADQITCWFLQGHNINNNNPSHYNIMNIYLAICVLVKHISAGTENGLCRDTSHFV